jgi:hypothetical protein
MFAKVACSDAGAERGQRGFAMALRLPAMLIRRDSDLELEYH